MIDFFARLFETEGFPARWRCGDWQAAHGWLHIGSDFAIFLAYFAIPIALLVFINRRKDAPFLPVFWLFGGFIAACGTGHLIESIIFWHPVYRFAGLVKALTALMSWATVIALIAILPAALSLRSPAQLEAEVAARTRDLEREKATLEAILERLNVGVLVADNGGQLRLINEAGRALAGTDEDFELRDLSGRILSAEERPMSRALRGEEVDCELLIRAAEAERIVAVSARPVLSERGGGGAVKVISDLTAIRSSERKLKQANESLIKAVRELKSSNRDLEQFAYIASHDLREPLRMVSSYAELLRKRYRSQIDERADRYLDYTIEGARRMRALIDDLLAFSRIKSREPSFADLELDLPYRKALRDLEKAIEESGAVIECGALPRVWGEVEPLSHVFQNLIGNAIKYSGEAPPKITIAAEREDDGLWLISVSDQGIGFEDEHRERIFEIFQRLHTRDKFEGSGIGLAIVKRVVERHGGEVRVESEPGVGSTFSFTLGPAKGEIRPGS